MASPRRAAPDIHTPNRALLELQDELKSLRTQLSQLSTAPTRQDARGLGRRFAQTGRGSYQLSHEIDSDDFLVNLTHDHTLLKAVRPIELTEAFWYPDENFSVPVLGYSFIRVHEHFPGNGKAPTDGRELGYISGEAKTAGPWATGDLVLGYEYQLQLSSQPRVAKGAVVVVDSETTSAGARWPTGYLLLVWRYTD